MGNNFGTMFTRRNRHTPTPTSTHTRKYHFSSCEECEENLQSTNNILYEYKHNLARSETLRYRESLIFETFLKTNDIAKQHKLFDKYNTMRNRIGTLGGRRRTRRQRKRNGSI